MDARTTSIQEIADQFNKIRKSKELNPGDVVRASDQYGNMCFDVFVQIVDGMYLCECGTYPYAEIYCKGPGVK